ncbi:hypothetical protein DW254_18970 [Bacteroides caccae]|nr:hypothetical protein DW254_18970 [Bacteroides caccae]
MPSGLLRICNTKQISADWLWLRMEIPIRCYRENLQGSTSLHFVGSHNGNGLGDVHLQEGRDARFRGLSEEYVSDSPLRLIFSLEVII